MTTRVARCACGALSATCTGEPVRRSVCHCLDCQRRTGAPFAFNATFREDQVRIDGESAVFTRTSEEGFWGRFHFCPRCGSNVHYEIERRPGMVSIPVGAFADPSFPEPTVSVYDERRHPWLRIETDPPIRQE
ncbi:GFA family protein [Sphingosinicella humi]|uniref:Aldehyde-activating protein n=1 Tax=Allosphingosinicella humi TaxID=2068657 RepID=A0A2U2J0F1_9SPHN|nr:GFA family protein [Sphingosinicella humi]PWG01761.1 aldehyde-activating protein [Sphingosinicella humi]